MAEQRELPDAARRKLAALQNQIVETRALAEVTRAQVGEHERQLRVLRSSDGSAAEAVHVEGELKRLQAVLTARIERLHGLQQVQAQLRDFVAALPSAVALAPAPSPPVEIEGTPQAHLDALRGQIARQRAELVKVISARAPVADAERQIVELVEAMAERGRPPIQTDRGRLQIPHWDPQMISGPVRLPSVANVLAWLFKDQMIAALTAELAKLPVDPDALPPAERERRQRQLEAEMLQAEREEEAVIEHAAGTGIDLPRRPDANPLAILGLAFTDAARRAA